MVKTLFIRTLWLNTAMLLLSLHDRLHHSTQFRWMWTQWGNDRLLDVMCGSCGVDEEKGKLLPCDLSNIVFILTVILVIGIIFKPAQGL